MNNLITSFARLLLSQSVRRWILGTFVPFWHNPVPLTHPWNAVVRPFARSVLPLGFRRRLLRLQAVANDAIRNPGQLYPRIRNAVSVRLVRRKQSAERLCAHLFRGIPPLHIAARKRTPSRIGTAPRGKHVVMLVVSDLRIDPRVEREARALASAGYSITVLCPALYDTTDPANRLNWGPSIQFKFLHVAAAMFMSVRPGFVADQMYYEAVKFRPFAFHAHDLSTAYAAFAAANVSGAHLIVDFHEWFSENVHWHSELLKWVPYPDDWKKDLQELEARCLSEASATITVCDSIADAMKLELGGRRPHLVRNIPNVMADPTRLYPSLKEQLGLAASTFVLLWQGGTGPTRLIEPIIEALAWAPRCVFVIRGPSLDLFGDGYRKLAEDAGASDRLILLPPVPSRDVVAAAMGADAGIWTLPALCRNFTYALPNKIFEYLASGLPVLAAHYPEAKRLVLESNVGLIFDPNDARSIATAINRLVDNPGLAAEFRRNTVSTLAGIDAEREWQRLVQIYDQLPRSVASQPLEVRLVRR